MLPGPSPSYICLMMHISNCTSRTASPISFKLHQMNVWTAFKLPLSTYCLLVIDVVHRTCFSRMFVCADFKLLHQLRLHLNLLYRLLHTTGILDMQVSNCPPTLSLPSYAQRLHSDWARLLSCMCIHQKVILEQSPEIPEVFWSVFMHNIHACFTWTNICTRYEHAYII